MKEIKLPHQHHSAEKNRAILEKIPDEETILAVADAMKHLGDPTRLRIFWLLDIAALVSMSSPAVSHHLRILKAAGLASVRREGKEVYYKAVESPIVRKLHDTIEEIAEIHCPKK